MVPINLKSRCDFTAIGVRRHARRDQAGLSGVRRTQARQMGAVLSGHAGATGAIDQCRRQPGLSAGRGRAAPGDPERRRRRPRCHRARVCQRCGARCAGGTPGTCRPFGRTRSARAGRSPPRAPAGPGIRSGRQRSRAAYRAGIGRQAVHLPARRGRLSYRRTRARPCGPGQPRSRRDGPLLCRCTGLWRQREADHAGRADQDRRRIPALQSPSPTRWRSSICRGRSACIISCCRRASSRMSAQRSSERDE